MQLCFLARDTDNIVFMNSNCANYLEESGIGKRPVDEIWNILKGKFSCDTFSLDGYQCMVFCLENRLLEIYEDVLNNLDEGIIISDDENRVIFINRACEAIEGIDRKKSYMKRMEELYTPTQNTPNQSMHSV